MNTKPQRHSLTGGSNAHLWLNCPAAPWLCRIVPVVETDAMRKGTQLHEQAARAFTDPAVLEDSPKLVREYVATVKRMMDQADHSAIEVEFMCEAFPEAFATADAVIIGARQRIYIDLKTGRTPVSPTANTQLAVLAVFAGEQGVVTGAIYQAGSLQTAPIDTEVWRPRVLAALAKVYGPAPTPCPGAHCAKCRACGFCPARATTEW